MQIASKYLYVKTKTGLSASQGWSTQMKTNTTIVSTISGLDSMELVVGYLIQDVCKDIETPRHESFRMDILSLMWVFRLACCGFLPILLEKQHI